MNPSCLSGNLSSETDQPLPNTPCTTAEEAAKEAMNKKEIWNQLAKIECEMSDLDLAVGALEKRLTPIVRPEEIDEKQPILEKECVTQLGRTLKGTAGWLNKLNKRLDSLISRIEI